jgi:hypothetical protein
MQPPRLNRGSYVLMLVALVILGTWSNGFRYLQTRVPLPILYLDMAVGTLLAGGLLGMILGNTGDAQAGFAPVMRSAFCSSFDTC